MFKQIENTMLINLINFPLGTKLNKDTTYNYFGNC